MGRPENPGPRVFLSYRREEPDSAYAGRVRDALITEFGADAVFQDVHSIPIGSDFREVLRDLVDGSDVVLALVGETWSDTILEPQDWVRWEISLALELEKPVLPLLLYGSSMPAPETLPAEIAAIAYHNAAPVRSDPDFVGDLERIVSGIRNLSESSRSVDEELELTAEETVVDVAEVRVEHAPTAPTTLSTPHHGKLRPLSVLAEGRRVGSGIEIDFVWLEDGAFTTASRVVEQGLLQQFEPDSSANTLQAERFLDPYVLPDGLRRRAEDASEVHITANDVVDDLPWELMFLDASGTPASARLPFWRSIAQLGSRPPKPVTSGRDALVVGNPPLGSRLPPLSGAVAEGRSLTRQLVDQGYDVTSLVWDVDSIRDGEAAKKIVGAMYDRAWSLFHYAGHSVQRMEDSTPSIPIGPHDDRIDENLLVQMEPPPDLVFLSIVPLFPPYGPDRQQHFARRMIEAGSEVIILSRRSFNDDHGPRFASAFYTGLLDGYDAASALQKARAITRHELPDSTIWSDFVAYGRRDFRLPVGVELTIRPHRRTR